MGQIAGILQGAGSVMGGIGGFMQADAARNAAKFNAKLSRRAGFREQARVRELGRRTAAENITRIAKSGVRIGGSPLEVLAENASQVEFEAEMAKQAGLLGSQLQRIKARQLAQAGTMSLVGGVIGGGSAIAGTNDNANALGEQVVRGVKKLKTKFGTSDATPNSFGRSNRFRS